MTFKSSRLKMLMQGSALAALSFGGAQSIAFAQEDGEQEVKRLTAVVITAEKREESVQDVPLSVTAISGDSLTAAGVTDLSTLDKLAPGLQFGQSGNDARPAIRGARTENVSVQQDPVVSFYVDGIYRSLTSQALASIVDVERVEVLRGPQGTLYGRNAFGGAVNIISRAPSVDPEYGGNLTLGNYGRVRGEAFGNIPLSDNLFFRLTAAIEQQDFIVENTFNPDAGLRDKDEKYLRAQLRYEPTDRFDITLRASHWTQGGNGNSDFGYNLIGTPTDTSSLQGVLTGGITPINPRVGGGNSPVNADPYTIDTDFETTLDTEQTTIDLESNYDLGFANLKFLFGYADFETFRDADTDLSSFSSGFSSQRDDVVATTQEIQLTSQTTGPLEWTVGGFFLQEDKRGTFVFDRLFNTDATTNAPDGTVATAFFADFNARADVETDSIALYGQATYALTEALRVTAGVRYTEDEKSFQRVTTGTNTVPITFFEADGVTPRPVFEDEATFDKTTFRLGGEYDINEDSLIYASVSTGFQSGGFNNSADSVTGGASFGPQEVTAYEIGSKNVLLDGDLILNVALYQNEFEDLLAQEFVNVGATTLAISTNAGEVTSTGVEIEADWAPTNELVLTGRASIQNSEFGDYLVGEPVSGETVNLDGGPVPLSPDLTLGLGALYDFALDNGATLTPAIDLYYSSDYNTNDVDYSFGRQDDYTTVDLRLTYTPESDDWYAEIFGTNVTDEEILNRTVRFGQNAIVQNFKDPAMYGIRFGFRQ
ncbi:MAG: TonB-dependent receptor [Pseudomonadota bacterium]